jgi:sulfide:quinone oxidoreductase
MSLAQDYLQMRVLELAPQVYVCGQVFETDLKLVAKQDVRTIVNNRPDGETPDQPASADLAKAAEELGMTFVHFPVESRSVSKEAAAEFAKTCDALERPILIFSATGVRATKIWEMAEPDMTKL